MKTLFATIIITVLSTTCYAQVKPDSIKSARDYIIENEDKRPLPPHIVKPDLKKLKPLEGTGPTPPKVKDKPKKCWLFCRKKSNH